MTDDIRYPSNSLEPRDRKHVDLRPATDKKISKVTSGAVMRKKKSFLDKVSETFWGDDASTVGNYIIYDVLIPAAKNTLFDMVKTGVEMLLFGESTQRRSIGSTRSNNERTIISYGSFYKGQNERRPADTSRVRSRNDFEQIIMTSRRDAQDVLDTLLEAFSVYKVVTVADFYDAAGAPSTFTDQNYGWVNLSRAAVIQVHGGWMVDLPRPLPLND